MLNKFIFSGRLVADPETRTSRNGNEFVTFSVAIKSNFKDGSVLFQDCIANGNQAKYIGRYLTKGDLATFVGTLLPNDYTNRDGQKIRRTVVNVSECYGAGRSENSDQTQNLTATTTISGVEDYSAMSSDDLPF